MLENSTAGLYLLDPAREVTVTREEDHQRALARYPVTHSHASRVAVELAWCVIASGKYRGERAIEVRLDGDRVGELTHAMTQRYGPTVAAVIAAGHRPGCEATITTGDRGLQIHLHLPPADAPPPHLAPVAPPPPRPAQAGPPTPPGGTYRTGIPGYPVLQPAPPSLPAQRTKKSKKVPVAFAGAVVGMVAIISSIASAGEDTPTSQSLPLTTTTATVQVTTERPTTTTTTRPTTTTTKPKPTTTTPKPKPKPTTTRPAPPPPAPAPEPDDEGCNPNYDPCVPNDPVDVDCAGGKGNGPSYVEGPVQVIGTDVYDLDRDNDGEGCE